MLLDDANLTDFMHNFYGYGTYAGDIWLVGMEEGGGHSCEEVAARLAVWEKRGRKELEDVAAYHIAFGVTQLFEQHPKIQPTWGKLIRLLLAAEGAETIEAQAVREFQRDRLGRLDSNHCLLELFPLPSRSINPAHWLYATCSTLPFLASRPAYIAHMQRRRVAHLRERIATHRPKAVVFYSLQYLSFWEEIAGSPFTYQTALDCHTLHNNGTTYYVLKHPATRGITSETYQAIGRDIGSAASST
jgi:hypothetical protein